MKEQNPGVRVAGPARLPAIEGLRAYLALWVLACHALYFSGYEDNAVGVVGRLVLQGFYPVDVFIIISGFVIFFLLDRQTMTYGQFVRQRFFRLFPLFITLFVAGILLYKLQAWNLRHSPFYSPDRLAYSEAQLASWTDHLFANIALHATMLHGVLPDAVIRDAPGAFLIPGWSISLEWQFYLCAPILYGITMRGGGSRLAIAAWCLGSYLAAVFVLPAVRYGAFLPFHIEYFFIGAASYYLYKFVSARPATGDTWFPVAIMVVATILFTARQWGQIPLMLWILFIGLVLEPRHSISSQLLMPLFENRVTQYLGKISYSIYLCHVLVIIAVQTALLTALPSITQQEHCAALLVACALITLGMSAFLYRYVEAPGIEFGRRRE